MSGHRIVRTLDDTRLDHDCHGCREGEYVQRHGLDEFERWAPGTYDVEFWSLFDADGEYACGLQLVHPLFEPDAYYPDGSGPQPQGGRVLGFPYEGGRWAG